MHMEIEEILRARIPAIQGRDAKNNKLVLETLALHGPLIKYDIFKALKVRNVRYYPTISRRVDDLKERGYLGIAGERTITVGKRREASPTYALTWSGFIASLTIERAIRDIPKVLENSPLLKFPVPRDMVIGVIKELFIPKEIETITRAIFMGFLKALPRDIESIEEEKYLAYIIPGLLEAPEIKEKIEKKDLSKLLQVPGFLEFVWNLIDSFETQLSESLKGIRIIRKRLQKYVQNISIEA